eukprot:7638605-Alexandrium_andersonii.AAC.1
MKDCESSGLDCALAASTTSCHGPRPPGARLPPRLLGRPAELPARPWGHSVGAEPSVPRAGGPARPLGSLRAERRREPRCVVQGVGHDPSGHPRAGLR